MELKILRASGLIGVICLLIGVIAGIWNMFFIRGVIQTPLPSGIIPSHGMLMIGGFLGLLVMVERFSVKPVGLLLWVPYFWGISILLFNVSGAVSRVMMVSAVIGWGIHRYMAFRSHRHIIYPLIEFFSYALLVKSIFMDGIKGVESVLCAFSFPSGIIAVERVGLKKKFFSGFFVFVFLFFMFLNGIIFDAELWITGVAFILLCLLTAYNDPVINMMFHKIPPQLDFARFSRQAVFIAYMWLFLAGVFLILWNKIPYGKDVVYHSLGLGFIFTMILAHAPIVIGAIFRVSGELKPFILPFYIFQILTFIRIAGDFSKDSITFTLTGLLTALLHPFVFLFYIHSVIRSLKSQ